MNQRMAGSYGVKAYVVVFPLWLHKTAAASSCSPGMLRRGLRSWWAIRPRNQRHRQLGDDWRCLSAAERGPNPRCLGEHAVSPVASFRCRCPHAANGVSPMATAVSPAPELFRRKDPLATVTIIRQTHALCKVVARTYEPYLMTFIRRYCEDSIAYGEQDPSNAGRGCHACAMAARRRARFGTGGVGFG